MTAEPDERTPPRLQDTSERDALPLPLPGSDQPPEAAPDQPAPIDEPAPIEAPAAAEWAPPADEPATEPVAAADPEPPPEEPAPEPEPEPESAPAASDNASEPESEDEPAPPPFQPAPSVAGLAHEDEGLPTEVLVGAAFLGGLALAILIRRLGN